MSLIENPGSGGGVGGGITTIGASTAAGVALPQTGILPETGVSDFGLMLVVAFATFGVIVLSNLGMRALRAYHQRQA